MQSEVYNYCSMFSQCINSTNDTVCCDVEFSTNKMTFCLNCNVYKSRMQPCWKKENDLSNLHQKKLSKRDRTPSQVRLLRTIGLISGTKHLEREYFGAIGVENTEHWFYPDKELHKVLTKFWFEVHTQRPPPYADEIDEARQNNADLHPELYTIMSLRNLHNGVSWCLQQKGKNINLTTDPKFMDS